MNEVESIEFFGTLGIPIIIIGSLFGILAICIFIKYIKTNQDKGGIFAINLAISILSLSIGSIYLIQNHNLNQINHKINKVKENNAEPIYLTQNFLLLKKGNNKNYSYKIYEDTKHYYYLIVKNNETNKQSPNIEVYIQKSIEGKNIINELTN